MADLSPLQGMLLSSLECFDTRVAQLSALQGMKLAYLSCDHTRVADISPLKGMPLEFLECDVRLYHASDSIGWTFRPSTGCRWKS